MCAVQTWTTVKPYPMSIGFSLKKSDTKNIHKSPSSQDNKRKYSDFINQTFKGTISLTN